MCYKDSLSGVEYFVLVFQIGTVERGKKYLVLVDFKKV